MPSCFINLGLEPLAKRLADCRLKGQHPAQDITIWRVCSLFQVEEITLNATIVRRSDGGRMWYSNTKLATSNVINLSRSDNKYESFKVSTMLCNEHSKTKRTNNHKQNSVVRVSWHCWSYCFGLLCQPVGTPLFTLEDSRPTQSNKQHQHHGQQGTATAAVPLICPFDALTGLCI